MFKNYIREFLVVAYLTNTQEFLVFFCSGSSADNILCPLSQYTDPKCVGQQEVHGQEPAGDGSGFRSEPNGANSEEQSEWLLWF